MTDRKKKTKRRQAPEIGSKKKVTRNSSTDLKITRKKSGKKAGKKTVRSAAQGRSRTKPKSKSRFLTMLRVFFRHCLWRIALFVFVIGFTFAAYWDVSIRHKFEGQKWALPAHVYTRPLELYVGQEVDRQLIMDELHELGYRERQNLSRVGSYQFSPTDLAIHQREFRFWDGLQVEQILKLSFDGNVINKISVQTPAQLLAGDQAREIEITRLEPRLFGSVSPLSHEDRSLLKLEEVPQQLINALIAIEDQQFYSHFGINPFGIARAMVANISAGRVVQGGSTLTQQLVKNYYLNSEQTIKRKLIEMVMAILLEIHYSKDEILQAYINEVYLSQEGNRAIHGFALGSQHFFGRPLQELDLPELATLAGMIKGPSYYNPIRSPERAKERRDIVLGAMLAEGFIDEEQFKLAKASKLLVDNSSTISAPRTYPSFTGFLRQGLKDQYQEKDISNDGLHIYTTLNPRIQKALETTLKNELDLIEKSRGMEANTLQGAAVVIRTDNGEVAAMVGDRTSKYSGYNRALRAMRPIGSLIKPFVYLTALENPSNYSLATRLSDTSITVSQVGSPDWKPQNYNGEEHGEVMLIDALAKSYNLATVRMGMDLGVEEVVQTLRRVGYEGNIRPLPSVLLGAVPMTVMEVGQLYLSIASGGFRTPIKGIRSVLSSDNEPLERYPLAIKQVIEPQYNGLITFALQEVVRSGTARSISSNFTKDYKLAGKTGTTDEYRDSWYAGFSGNYLSVVWVGRDDNKPTGLSGASGAARIWAKVMSQVKLEPIQLPFHEDVKMRDMVYTEGSNKTCNRVRVMPVILGSDSLEKLPCKKNMKYDLSDEESKHFEPRNERKPKKKSFWERFFN